MNGGRWTPMPYMQSWAMEKPQMAHDGIAQAVQPAHICDHACLLAVHWTMSNSVRCVSWTGGVVHCTVRHQQNDIWVEHLNASCLYGIEPTCHVLNRNVPTRNCNLKALDIFLIQIGDDSQSAARHTRFPTASSFLKQIGWAAYLENIRVVPRFA